MRRPETHALLVVALVVGTLAATSLMWLWPDRAAAQSGSSLQVIQTIPVGGKPDKVFVVCGGVGCIREHGLAYYDSQSNKLRFLAIGSGAGAGAIALSLGLDGDLTYSRYFNKFYAVVVDRTCNNEFGFDCWEEATVLVYSNRQFESAFSVNEQYDGDPPNPSGIARYSVRSLLVTQQAGEDLSLYVHDIIKNNVDVVKLTGNGLDNVGRRRLSYRSPVPCYDQQMCSYHIPSGQTLALRKSSILYVNDGAIYAMGLGATRQAPAQAPLPVVDFVDTFPFGNGVNGLATDDRRDILYTNANAGSFDIGYLGIVDASQNVLDRVVEVQYRTQRMHVDHADPKRVFLLTKDGFCRGSAPYDPSCSLYLKMLYEEQVVGTVRLIENAPDAATYEMDYDPYKRRLYVSVNDTIMVIQVNHGVTAMPPGIIASIIVQPGETNILHGPDGSVSLTFPANAVSKPTEVTYEELAPNEVAAAQQDVATSTGLRTVRTFALRAVVEGTNTPVDTFSANVQLLLTMTDTERAGTKASSLRIYRRSGTAWTPVSGGFSIDPNRFSVSLDKPGTYAIRGEAEQIFLPYVGS